METEVWTASDWGSSCEIQEHVACGDQTKEGAGEAMEESGPRISPQGEWRCIWTGKREESAGNNVGTNWRPAEGWG